MTKLQATAKPFAFPSTFAICPLLIRVAPASQSSPDSHVLLNAELNPICHLLALLRAHHIIHVGRIRVKHRAGKKWGWKNSLTAQFDDIETGQK
jgi:hypothetical protein